MENIDSLSRMISEGVDLAKGGDARSVYENVKQHPVANIPVKSHYAVGWILYYALHQASDNEVEYRKELLDDYYKFSLPRPHKLHSMILTEAVRLYADAKKLSFSQRRNNARQGNERGVLFSLMEFALRWNLSNLRPGDWKRKEYEGKLMNAVVEKFITQYVDEMESTGTAPSADFIRIIETSLTQYPDSVNLLAQRASVCVAMGEKERAADLLRKAILTAPGKFYLWGKLAQITDGTANPRLRMGLLAKALGAPGPEIYKGRIRLELARVWIEQNCHSQALWELDIFKRLYQSQKWHMPDKYEKLISRIPEGTEMKNPVSVYQRLLTLADDEIYSLLPPVEVKKTYHKEAGQSTRPGYSSLRPVAWRVTDNAGNNYWLQPHRFNLPPTFPIGGKLTIRLYNGRPVKAEVPETV